MIISNKRDTVLKQTIARRQNMTVVLENIHDPHNIGAVMRTCDAVGIQEIYVLITDQRIDHERYVVGKTSSSGIRKWLDIHLFTDTEECFSRVRSQYDHIYGTHLSEHSKDLYEIKFSEKPALVFGNEHDGISNEAMKHIDQNITIPQMGLVRSLNISVACAVSVYELLRQRKNKGLYDVAYDESNEDHKALFAAYLKRHKKRP